MVHLSLSDDHLVFDFPYDAEQVAEIKRIKGAKWDKVARVWRLPITALEESRGFAGRHNFVISSEVMLFTLPKHKNSDTNGVYLKGEWIYLAFDYDPVRVRSVKQIAGITWHAKTKAWRAPTASISEVVGWATTFKQPIESNVTETLKQIESSLTELKDASRMVDAELEVAGLPLLPYQRAGVSYASNARRTFIADEMGLGKTLQVLALLTAREAEVVAEPKWLAIRAQLHLDAGQLDAAARDGLLLWSRYDRPDGMALAFAATAGRGESEGLAGHLRGDAVRHRDRRERRDAVRGAGREVLTNLQTPLVEAHRPADAS